MTSAILALAPAVSRAADSTWTGPGGGVFDGVFQTASNWSAGVPGPDDAATFDLAQSYRVSFNGDATNRALFVGGGGNVTFAPSALHVSSSLIVPTASIASNSALTLADSRLILTGDGLSFGANSTLTVASEKYTSALLQVPTLDLPGANARFNLQGLATLRTGLIHVGDAANPPGSTLAQFFANSGTIGSATARTDLIIERGGHVSINPSRFFVGKTIRVSGGILDRDPNHPDPAGAIDFAPDATMIVDQGGTAQIEAIFNGASITVHGAGNTLAFTGSAGSPNGSTIDIADGAFGQIGYGSITPTAIIGSQFASGRAELRFSNGAVGLFGAVFVGSGYDGNVLITGKGTTVNPATNGSSALSIGGTSGASGAVNVTAGGTLNATFVTVKPTGTLSLDNGNLTINGGLNLQGGIFRMSDAASLVLKNSTRMTVNAGASAYFSGGTVSGTILVNSGATAFIDGAACNLVDADVSPAGGVITANGPVIAKHIGLTSGALFNGNGSISVSNGFELDDSTIAGSGDVTIHGNFGSFGTNTSRVLDSRSLFILGGGFLAFAHDIEIAPSAKIVNASDLNVNAAVRLVGGRFDNQGAFQWNGVGASHYTSMFNNDGSVILTRLGSTDASVSFDGGGTHTGSFNLSASTTQGDFRFGGGNHLFQPASTVRGTNVAFDGAVNATLLGKVTALNELTVTGAASVTAGAGATFDLAASTLSVTDHATLRLANANSSPLSVGALNVTDNGVLDLTRGAAIVNNPAATPLARVAGDITRGYHAGAWTGPGILSSDAAASPRYAVGYAQASAVLAPGQTFFGQSVDPTDILIRFTLAGDATMDGEVDFSDLSKLAQSYNGPGDWSHGDFNYDGMVDFADLAKLAQNYNTSLGAAAPIPGASAAFDADLARAFASVPEPGPLSSITGYLLLMLQIRRRRGK